MIKSLTSNSSLILIGSLIGIFLLIYLANFTEPKVIDINETKFNQINSNQNIKISGKVTNIKSFEELNFQIIKIKDSTGEILVLLNNPLNLSKNNSLEVIGKLEEYNHTLQIQAEKIILIK